MPFALTALVSLVPLVACSDDPDPYKTDAYAVTEITMQVTASADAATQSGIDVRALLLGDYKGRKVELRLGGEDVLVASLDGRDDALDYAVPDYHGPIRDGSGRVDVVLVREGHRASFPVPLPKPFTVSASPAEFAIGDRVTIDLSPRPELSKDTTVELVPETCAGSLVRIFATELPYVWDTTPLKATNAPQPCAMRFTAVVETTGSKPFASGLGAFAPESSARAKRGVRGELELRP